MVKKMQFLEENQEMFIICSNAEKKKIIDFISRSSKMYNVHFFTMSEIRKKLFFDYSKEALYETSRYLKVKPAVAKIYMDNLYFVEDREYNNEKLDQLVDLKRRLDTLNLLSYDPYFLRYIEKKKVFVYNLPFLSKFELYMIDQIKKYAFVSFYEEEKKVSHPVVYHASTLEDEVEFVANRIGDLLMQGIDIHKIKIANIDENYYAALKRIFSFYHIPINMGDRTSLFGTQLGQDFIEHYSSSIDKTITYLQEKYTNEEINKIISIVNNYNFVKDYDLVKDWIVFDLKNTYLREDLYKDAVNVVSIEEVLADDFVFLMNFNLNAIPKFKKDEDFITDSLKSHLHLDLTVEENKKIALKTKNQILNIKNLILTYKDKSMTMTYYPSNLIDDLSLQVEDATYPYQYSALATKIKLAKKMDKFIKYGSKDEDIDLLYSSFPIAYQSYDNQFTGIDKNDFYDYMHRDLKLSYSTLDAYNRCAFRYYLTSVLKLDIYEETFVTFIGSLFHFILEKGLTQDINITEEVGYFIKRSGKELSLKERFLLQKLVKELDFIIMTIKEQATHSQLKDLLLEDKIEIRKDREIPVVFKGFVDKICFKKIGDQTIVAIVDYKTGNTSIDLNNSVYGIGMQLPIYLYLAANCDKIENVSFAGFYLQKILSEEVLIDEKKSLEEIKKENLKLYGFSNSSIDILKCFDNSYEDSKVIRGMGLYKNGNFKTKKVLSNEQIKNLISLTENVVDHTIDSILQADFTINPKQIGSSEKDKLGCAYCKFRDICFVKQKDFVHLKKQEYLDFLGGDGKDEI